MNLFVMEKQERVIEREPDQRLYYDAPYAVTITVILQVKKIAS
jgi:hypothetical protein